MKSQIQIIPNMFSYKTGIDEIVGLKAEMIRLMKPIAKHLNELQSWTSDDWFKLSEAEYKSRDGFIAHSHNCGGILICSVVPKCGESEFDFIDFGTCETCSGSNDCAGGYCAEESDGLLDACIRIWFKFEGINEDGELEFYLNVSGGNGDAPYFRPKYLKDLFEAEFKCKSVAGIQRASSKHFKALIKTIGDGK